MDLSWSELMVVGIVALVVIGPKDLPGMFRELGRFTAKIRAMGREFSRAMEQAAKETGVQDVADDLKKVANPKAMGLDAVKSAADKFEKWDPLKNAARPSTPTATAPATPAPAAPAATPATTAPAATPAAPAAAPVTPAAPAAAAAPVVEKPLGPATAALAEKQAARKAASAEKAATLRKASAPAPAPEAQSAPAAAKKPGRVRKKAGDAASGETA